MQPQRAAARPASCTAATPPARSHGPPPPAAAAAATRLRLAHDLVQAAVHVLQVQQLHRHLLAVLPADGAVHLAAGSGAQGGARVGRQAGTRAAGQPGVGVPSQRLRLSCRCHSCSSIATVPPGCMAQQAANMHAEHRAAAASPGRKGLYAPWRSRRGRTPPPSRTPRPPWGTPCAGAACGGCRVSPSDAAPRCALRQSRGGGLRAVAAGDAPLPWRLVCLPGRGARSRAPYHSAVVTRGSGGPPGPP